MSKWFDVIEERIRSLEENREFISLRLQVAKHWKTRNKLSQKLRDIEELLAHNIELLKRERLGDD